MTQPGPRVFFIPNDGSFDPNAPTLADFENAVEVTQAFAPAKVLDHVVCPTCVDTTTTYLCGATREDQIGEVTALTGSFIGTPCAVCFEAPVLTCNRCGTEIQTCP